MNGRRKENLKDVKEKELQDMNGRQKENIRILRKESFRI